MKQPFEPSESVEVTGMLEDEVKAKASEVSDESAWALIESVRYAGFVVVSKAIDLPPQASLVWPEVQDVRMFGPKGEWHFWRNWGGEVRGRFLESPKECDTAGWSANWLLRGTKIGQKKKGWWPYQQGGGTVWLRQKVSPENLRLHLRQHVGRQADTGLAGVIDAQLLGIYDGETRLTPA